jgi:tRNA A37 threonylcarbamoyladenosine synthetase subunit TsaC/SUA5/YrdC
MGSNIFSKQGYEKIIALKGSRGNKPFSILFSGLDQVKEYFNVPINWNFLYLEEILKMEVTLGFPKEWLKVEVPPWLIGDSPYIAFRCLDNLEIKQIIEREGAPITTTSLNRSDDPPAKTLEEAKAFEEANLGQVELVSFSKEKLSGNPSTIVFFQNERNFKIQRAGKNAKEIEPKLRLLST